ncbi:flavin reductase family protein [Streptomyces sp. cmx-4-9]|uniref:flavin reductase family protein n=1 Tax=Streptomyces sp. cmx-4-9 TaxID=2790941 RepID=UPI00397E9243
MTGPDHGAAPAPRAPAPAPPAVDDAGFRDAMAAFPCAVTVVTAYDGARVHGTTVSAVASLSRNPPLVMVALAEDSELLAVIRRSGRFGINVLADGQEDWARAFAAKGRDKGAGIPLTDEGGVPRLPGVPAWMACRVAALTPGGDHVIVQGAVEYADTRPQPPLVYHRRAFGTCTGTALEAAGSPAR